MDTEVSLALRDLMSRFRSGDRGATDALVAHLYPELRRIAAAKMRTERPEHTWTPTVLVNELYLELVKIRALGDAPGDFGEREAFLGLAGHIMRRLLIHHSRPLSRKVHKIEIGELDAAPTIGQVDGPEALAQVEGLLDRLMKIDPRLRTVVELRVFNGQTAEEAAVEMGCSPRSVHKYWSFARRWLATELER